MGVKKAISQLVTDFICEINNNNGDEHKRGVSVLLKRLTEDEINFYLQPQHKR